MTDELHHLTIAAAATMLIASVVLGRCANKKIKARTTKIKDIAYECGMLPQGEAQPRFSVKFYLVAMLFIIFDVEIVFFYPWAVVYRQLRLFGFIEMLIFVGIFVVGNIYIWKKGVLDWR